MIQSRLRQLRHRSRIVEGDYPCIDRSVMCIPGRKSQMFISKQLTTECTQRIIQWLFAIASIWVKQTFSLVMKNGVI